MKCLNKLEKALSVLLFLSSISMRRKSENWTYVIFIFPFKRLYLFICAFQVCLFDYVDMCWRRFALPAKLNALVGLLTWRFVLKLNFEKWTNLTSCAVFCNLAFCACVLLHRSCLPDVIFFRVSALANFIFYQVERNFKLLYEFGCRLNNLLSSNIWCDYESVYYCE